MSADLVALVERLSMLYHQAGRSRIYERSGSIARDLAALRSEVNEMRALAGLGPSPIEPTYPEEETEG